ncbi:MAG: hypothetical protein ACOY4Q_09605 [Bacillota bacterium]
MKKSVRFETILAVLAALLLFSGMFFLTGERTKPAGDKYPQEFKDLNIVQFYLHMSGGDYIIGREKKSYDKVMDAARKAVLSINKPLAGEGLFSEERIQEIKSNTVALSIWMPEPQKVSTRIKANDGMVKDKYGNSVVVTDRFLLVLGKKYQGKVFTRGAETGQWRAWDAKGEGFMPLIEAVRTGGL